MNYDKLIGLDQVKKGNSYKFTMGGCRNHAKEARSATAGKEQSSIPHGTYFSPFCLKDSISSVGNPDCSISTALMVLIGNAHLVALT